jgi:SAM-dependent methyltransferase
MAATVAEHYSKRKDRTLDERKELKTLKLRNLNLCLRNCYFAKLIRKGDSALDIACGKGGSTKALFESGAERITATDIAPGSVEDAKVRLPNILNSLRRGRDGGSKRHKSGNNLADEKGKLAVDIFVSDVAVDTLWPFGPKGDDMWDEVRALAMLRVPRLPPSMGTIGEGKHLTTSAPGVANHVAWRGYPKFDFATVMYALHYSWESETKARKFVENTVSQLKKDCYLMITIPDKRVILERLKVAQSADPADRPISKFGNSIYTVNFLSLPPSQEAKASSSLPLFGAAYEFTLEEAVDKCVEYLVDVPVLQKLLAEWGLEMEVYYNFLDAFEKNRGFDLGKPLTEIVSPEELEVFSLYAVITFKRTRIIVK